LFLALHRVGSGNTSQINQSLGQPEKIKQNNQIIQFKMQLSHIRFSQSNILILIRLGRQKGENNENKN
jgi:hypothetical protein